MTEERKTMTKVFVSLTGDLEDMVRKINEFLKDKTNAKVSFHNVEGKDFTYVIATVKAIPQKLF